MRIREEKIVYQTGLFFIALQCSVPRYAPPALNVKEINQLTYVKFG
jgi:hypothetical protein